MTERLTEPHDGEDHESEKLVTSINSIKKKIIPTMMGTKTRLGNVHSDNINDRAT
jgi:hypothetical protein